MSYFSGLDVEKHEAGDSNRFLYQLLLDFISFLAALIHLWATEWTWFGGSLCSDRNTSLLSCPCHNSVLGRGSARGAETRPSDKLHEVFAIGVPQQLQSRASVGTSGNSWHVIFGLRKLRGDICPCGGKVQITVKTDTAKRSDWSVKRDTFFCNHCVFLILFLH